MLHFIAHPDVSKVRSAFVLKSWRVPEEWPTNCWRWRPYVTM